MQRLHYMHTIDFGFKNLHQPTKKWSPEVVTTFLVLFSSGNHKLTSQM